MQHSNVTLNHCEQFQFKSDHARYSYEIRVSIPSASPPEEGFPVYYVLDGLSYFQYAHDVIRLQSHNELKTHVAPALIVGIGHPEQEMRQRRFYDFTAPANTYHYPDRLQGRNLAPHGGAENFIHFIEQELKPYIEKTYTVNTNKQTLFGHSLGGYFTLWTLFTRPEAFQTYLAFSPSLWWNDHELYRYAEQYLKHQAKQRRLFIAVGEQEGFMVEDSKKLSRSMLHHQAQCELHIAQDENHASVVPTMMSRAFRFAQ